MEHLYSEDPIIACSTGNTSNSAIAVIRLSGFENFQDLSPYLNLDFQKITPRRAYYCKLSFKGVFYDDVVAVFYKGPSSYNGENILELSAHGSVVNVDRIIYAFIESGFVRHAHPGEFSYRALKNGKLNLSQVEGLDLLLNASSNFALEQGFSLLNGQLQSSYRSLYQNYLNHRSAVEMSIDFLEDMGEERANKEFNNTLEELCDSLFVLRKRISVDSSKLINPEIALIGQPNAGKSSLFNLIVQEERSIVTAIAGTTRDYVSENINIEEVHYRLIDTAGVRESIDVIEMEGVRRSIKVAEQSFFKMLVINPFEINQDYFHQLENLDFDLVLFTHGDKKGFIEKVKDFLSGPMGAKISGPMGAKINGPMGAKINGPMGAKINGPMGANSDGSIGALKKLNDFVWLTSLKEKNKDLITEIESIVNSKYLDCVSNEPILLQRHKQQIFNIDKLLKSYKLISQNEEDISIISSELNSIGHCISELVGIVSPDDVLHNIFDNFCIGK